MRLYDGENIEGFNQVNVDELKSEFPDEGMDGIDPRYVINRISSTIIRKKVPSINALDVLRSLKEDRKSTRLNSSHVAISYAVFCLKKKMILSDARAMYVLF